MAFPERDIIFTKAGEGKTSIKYTLYLSTFIKQLDKITQNVIEEIYV